MIISVIFHNLAQFSLLISKNKWREICVVQFEQLTKVV